MQWGDISSTERYKYGNKYSDGKVASWIVKQKIEIRYVTERSAESVVRLERGIAMSYTIVKRNDQTMK